MHVINVIKLVYISQILFVTLEHVKVSERKKYINVRNAQKPFPTSFVLRLI